MDALDNTDSGDDSTSHLKEQNEKRHSFMGDELLNFETVDLEEDGWHDVFDEGDEASVDEDASATSDSSGALPTSKSPTNEALSESQQLSPLNQLLPLNNSRAEKRDSSTTLKGTKVAKDDSSPLNGIGLSPKGFLDATKEPSGTSTADTTKSDKGKNGAISAGAFGDWHDPVLDKPHREKMINDILQMLFARKKEKNPDEKWVARLKAQARAFESQLYKNASSLESYNDRTTLKRRIAKLADAFASYFKQAKQRKNFLQNSSSNRSNTAALSSDLQHRSMDSLPNAIAGNLRRQQSLPAPSSSAPTLPGPLMNSMARAQSESLAQTASNFNRPSASTNMSPSIVPGNFNSMMGSNLVGMMGNTMGMQQQQQQQNNQQLQQQLLASIQQQQQQVMARQMALGGGQAQGPGNMMSGQAGMMGNSGMSLLNQIQQHQQQQQQANPMMMNLMQQQQNLMQQQPNTMGLNMMQNPNAAMMMANNGMNAMNMNIIPGTSMAGVGSMQGMNFGNDSLLGAQEMLTMPPPGMLNTAGMQGMPNRQPGMNDDSSPLSPGTFHW